MLVANLAVYGNAMNGVGGTDGCSDLSAYVCLIGVFMMFVFLFCVLILVLWWHSSRGNAEPFNFGTSAVLRWGTAIMFLFWVCHARPALPFSSLPTLTNALSLSAIQVCVFFVGFAAMKWINKDPCLVKHVKGMFPARAPESISCLIHCWFVADLATADVIFSWFAMAFTIYLIITRRPQFSASV
jgi:hypothetical protein